MTGRVGRRRWLPVAFTYREYRMYWCGAAFSNVGTWMQNLTVPFVLFELTGSGTWVGLSIVAQIVPGILLNPFAGTLADRFSRRDVLRVTLSIAGLFALAQAVAWAAGNRSPVVVIVLVGLGGAANLTIQPAWHAMFADLVPPEARLSAITLQAGQINIARAVGPAIGGIALGTVGATGAFVFNALSFLVVVVILSFVHPEERGAAAPPGRVLSQYRDAVAFARRHPGLPASYALTATIGAFVYPMFQLLVVFTEDVYHVGPGYYGLLASSFGIGAVAGAAWLSITGSERARSTFVQATLMLVASGTLALGLLRSYWIGVAALAIVGLGSVCIISIANTTVQISAPPDMRGRLLALWVLSYMAAYSAGSIVHGWLADVVGAGAVAVIAGVILAAIAAVFLLRADVARSLDRAPTPTPVPDAGAVSETASAASRRVDRARRDGDEPIAPGAAHRLG